MKHPELVLWGFAMVLLGGCAVSPTSLATSEPSPATSSCAPLEAVAAINLVEIFSGGTPGARGQVVALQALPGSDVVMSLHIGNPSLAQWKLWDQAPFMEVDLDLSSRHGAGFSQSGNLAIGATTSDEVNEGVGIREHVGGILVWKTETGDPYACIEAPCPDLPSSTLTMPTLVGATLDPMGNTALIFNELGVIRVTLPDVSYEEIFDNASPEIKPDDLRTIGSVAFDHSSNRYAVGFEEGQVVVTPFRRAWWDLLDRPFVLGRNDPSGLISVSAMNFSPDGKWLAQARGDFVRVWDLVNGQGNPTIELSLQGASKLVFDQTSEYLFAATPEELLVIRIADGSVVGHYATPGISALTVSPDNRLLIWGDVSGSIHALGDCGI